jgi:16S rRNA (cytidine1402-2'-O)-methyltransferase
MAKLYLIPTPIGNLEDITFRAVRLLKEADIILAEDTRTTAILLKHYDIHTPLQSHHQHNEHQNVKIIARKICDGQNIALVSDAGTPGISDPGFLLLRECLKQGIEIECLPGATAFVPALINSGIPCDRFYFEGFLPVKKGRQSRLKELSELSHTIILYESPFRLLKTLEQLILYFGEDRKASVSRELTKIHEENVRGNLKEIVLYFSSHLIKGEIVILVEGSHR